jgi:hypothetical protein
MDWIKFGDVLAVWKKMPLPCGRGCFMLDSRFCGNNKILQN